MANDNNNTLTIRQRIASMLPWMRNGTAGGNILDSTGANQAVTQDFVKATEPFGTIIPKRMKERASGWSQLQNVSHNFDIQKVQEAFRAAERGDMTRLFAFYRDFFIGNGMVAAQLSKRKLATISEPYKVIPADKKKEEDVKTANAIQQILENCESFDTAVVHLMNATVFPVAALEKTFEEVDISFGNNEFNLRYKIKKLLPVDYQLITYRLPYLPQGPINTGNQPALTPNVSMQSLTGRPEDTIYDQDSWEPDLRFWSVFDNGLINYSYSYMQEPDPNRHIIYRSNLLQGIARENFGGLGKAILWWSIMSQMGADVFLRCLQKYGLPFIKVQADTAQLDTVQEMIQTFGDVSSILNAIVVNKDAVVDIEEMNYSGAADAHEKFLKFCQDQICLLINGQTLDSKDSTGGLGTGKNSLQGEVRKDIVNYDQRSLDTILRFGLFRQLMEINGLKGNIPHIVWGGDDITDITQLSSALQNLHNAGFEPTPDSIEQLSEKFGFSLQKIGQGPEDKKNPLQDKEGLPGDKDNNGEVPTESPEEEQTQRKEADES